MLRIRTGAPHGLRGGMFGLVATVLTFTTGPADAAPYADIVIDANSGAVLQATNPDGRRHPASLTKIMTLYLLFEQLEAGKLKLDSQLKVSSEASGQSPTKLGLKAGSTIAVEDAIKGIITRSANDAAVVVAEAIAGDEEQFAKLMTRKAQALGMTRTVYRNASGLPDDDQVTTARDQAMLGRAIQERFPRYYKYFSTRSFSFRGQWISNHNRLLGRVEGVDGIKTGYIRSSGYNLVTSVHRGNRYLVAVVMGGTSAGSRDARMRELINEKITLASTKRTAPIIAEAGESVQAQTLAKAEVKSDPKADVKVEPKALAKIESKPDAQRAAKVEPKAEPRPESSKAEPRFAIASATSTLAGPNPSAAASEPATGRSELPSSGAPARLAVGSTDPIRPVLVKTLTVRAGTTQTAPTPPLHVPSLPAAEHAASQPSAPAAAAKNDPPTARVQPPVVTPAAAVAPPKNETRVQPEAAAAAPMAAVKNEPVARTAAPAAAPSRAAAGEPTPKPQARSGWIIQVGAYHGEQEAKQRLSAVQSKASKVLTGANPFTESFDKGGTTYYRARFAGLDKDQAEAACKYLKSNDVECVTIKN